MCGRTACTLAPAEICQACSRESNGNFHEPTWIDHPGNKVYKPSTNIAPSLFTPILFRKCLNDGGKRNRDGEAKTYTSNEYSVMPMRWGLIPTFFKGATTTEFKYKTNNCRIEDMTDKAMYKQSILKGQRCVVLCDGFYEWQTTKKTSGKQPFFIHAPQPTGIEVWNREHGMSDNGWRGHRLLMMAGLYSLWISSEGEQIYTYTVITMESEEDFSWLHHRVPAILNNFEEVDNWLSDGVFKDKLSKLSRYVTLCSYKVSILVNNSRHQDPANMKPIHDQQKNDENTKSQEFMSSWLGTSSKKVMTPSKASCSKPKENKGILSYFNKVQNP